MQKSDLRKLILFHSSVAKAERLVDIAATIYDAPGVSLASELRDRQNRPVALNCGQVIQPLYSGSSG